jgi:hypothetical protein
MQPNPSLDLPKPDETVVSRTMTADRVRLWEARGREVSPPVVRDKGEPRVVREELALAAVAVRRLREVPLRPDLPQSFAAAVMDVRPKLGSGSRSAWTWCR